MINYDPQGKPDIDDESLRKAHDYGMHVFQIVCSEPDDVDDEQGGVNFLTIAPFLPRVDEIITLQDGKDCVVKRVFHKVGTMGGKTPALFPQVYAVLI